MHYHVNFVEAHVEKPAGFDDFEALVHHCGGIYGDALPHLPIWMRQSLFWCDLRKTGQWQFPERAARCCKHEAADLSGFPTTKALVDGVVLAVYRQQRDSGASYGGHDDFARCDQNFLICQRDVLAELDGFVGCRQADYSDGGGDYDLGIGVRGYALHPFWSKQDLGARHTGGRAFLVLWPAVLGFKSAAKSASGGFASDRYNRWVEFRDLLGREFDVRTGGQRDDLEFAGVRFNDVESLTSNGPGGAQDGNLLHVFLFYRRSEDYANEVVGGFRLLR